MSSDNFILELKLNTTVYQENELSNRFEIARKMYNITLSFALKRLTTMKESKIYRKILNEYIVAKKNKDKSEIKRCSDCLTEIRETYELSEYQLHEYISKVKHKYNDCIDINTSQKIATRVWKSISDILFKDGETAHFKKYKQMTSIEGKSNRQGIMFKCDKINGYYLQWGKDQIPAMVRKNDRFAIESLECHRIKYSRIVTKIINRKPKYYVQLVMDGIPPVKRINSTGELRHKLVNSRVGLDIGTSTLAGVAEDVVFFKELAPKVLHYEKKIQRIQRYLDRSTRACNSGNFRKDGTMRRGVKLKWVRSKKYKLALLRLKELYRLKNQYVTKEHNKYCNYILSHGNDIYVENMNFKALVKRSKNTEMNDKGKFKKKKRFGRSIGNKSPAKLMNILNQKLNYQGKKLNKVNTRTFKASQYNHVTDKYEKKKLSQRWLCIDGDKIQRDLYSAYLIKNSSDDLQRTNRNLCTIGFENFLNLHNKCIQEIIENKITLPSSSGIKIVY